MATDARPRGHASAAAAFEAALAAYDQADWDAAYRLAIETLQFDPRHPGALFLAAVVDLDRGQAKLAVERLNHAAELAPAHPGIRRSLGQAHTVLGEWEQAADALQWALRLGPADPELFAELGLALHHLEDFNGALAAFRESLRLDPRNADIHNNLAVTLNRKHDYEGAASAYEQARLLDPNNVSVLANLAMLYEQMNQLEKAESVVAAGLPIAPDNGLLHLVAARCERRQGEPEKAVARVRRLLDNPRSDLAARRALHFELGRDYDLMGDFGSAYRHFTAGNRVTDDIWPDMKAAGLNYLAELERDLGGLDTAALQELACRPAPATQSPVFLVSFPRSGTTLIDTILGAHPDVAVMEEEPPLHHVQQAIQQRYGDDPKALLALTGSELESLRELYWTETEKYLGQRANIAEVVVDKNPFYSTRAALIHLLFPQARFVFAQRHPLAVILSCFMQPFGRNPALANFTDLHNAAEEYRLVMELWLRFRRHLPLEVHDLRYESLVDDKESSLRETLAFLGLDWHDSLSDHVSHARKRGRIYTPSYHQVSRPIYTDSVDRWRNYAEHLSAVGERLRPFISEFGYDA